MVRAKHHSENMGITSPTNPTRPDKLTIMLTIRDVTTRSSKTVFFTLIPMAAAVSLPRRRRFMGRASMKITTKQGTTRKRIES